MKWYIFKSQSEPGFRLNLFDLGFMGSTLVLSLAVRELIPGATIYLIPPYIAGSFFLFCNVFRIGHLLEPFWYVLFTALAIYTLSNNDLEAFWFWVLLAMEPLKWVLIAYRMIRGPYHGVGFAQVARWKNKPAR